MIKVSFDADGTLLGHKSIREYAADLVNSGIEVHVVTRRFQNPESYSKLFCIAYGIKDIKKEHQELFEVAKECGIKEENIHFMNMADKYEFFAKNNGFLWHLDDDYLECDEINSNTKTVGISCSSNKNWRIKCDRLIEKYK